MQLERRAGARVGPSRGRSLLRGNLGQVYFSHPDRNEIREIRTMMLNKKYWESYGKNSAQTNSYSYSIAAY